MALFRSGTRRDRQNSVACRECRVELSADSDLRIELTDDDDGDEPIVFWPSRL